MQRLATFIMRGAPQAVLVTVLASLLPLLSWFGATVVALVTMRSGAQRGLVVIAATSLVLMLLYGLMAGMPQLALSPLVNMWLPAFVLAWWLRRTVSLASTLRLAAVLAGLAVIWMHLRHPDLNALWRPLLEQLLGDMDLVGAVGETAWPDLLERVLPLMTSMLVLSLAATVVFALLMARWLQALLYHPGGFQQEFQGLDLGWPMAAGVALLMVAAMWHGYGLIYDLAFVVSAVFVLQALSLGHLFIAKRGRSRAWLIGMYVLLPLLFELAVVIGIADAVFDWRRRFLAGSGGGNAA